MSMLASLNTSRQPGLLVRMVNRDWMLSKVWKCSGCGRMHAFAEAVHAPTPCSACQGLAFEKR
jgi:hypothetical protein